MHFLKDILPTYIPVAPHPFQHLVLLVFFMLVLGLLYFFKKIVGMEAYNKKNHYNKC